jgi:hypothetical protein
MERVLRLYALPYDPKKPVFCFDERPCFLIGNKIEGLSMKPGSPAKEDYEYEKNGSCSVLAAIEPLTGRRIVHVRRFRTKREFAIFMKHLAKENADADIIRVVLDNLNTHNISAFYETFSAEEALALSERFEFVHTPVHGSWLNMIELEFSVLSRQCLDRRIPNINILGKEVLAFMAERDKNKVIINWQFNCEKAREKFKKHYAKACPLNAETNKYNLHSDKIESS